MQPSFLSVPLSGELCVRGAVRKAICLALGLSLSLPFPLINEGLIRMRARDRSVDYNPSTLKFLSLSPTERESIEREKGKESRKK